VLARSSELQEARAAVQQAEAMLRRAQVEWVPNLQLSVRPFYAFPEQKALVRVEAGAMLPLFNRNQGNIAAAQADLARAHQEVRQAELRLTERLTGAYQRYQNARLQTEVYDKQILPNAAESLRLVRLGYERGDPKYDYTAVLQAQRILVEARLAYVQALGDLWRAASEIAGLLQLDQATLDGLAP
jgi:cobalt-zinc-cadmium efflux system outer membrane protein